MKRFFALIGLLVVLSLVLTACAGGTGTHVDAIKKAGVMKIGTSADYPPFESVDASGNKVGFDIELMTEVAKRMNVKLEWVDMPFDSLIAAVQGNKIDGAISAFNVTPERQKMVDFTDSYYDSTDGFLVADSFAGTITKPDDIVKYKVGVGTGTTQETYLKDTFVKTNKLPEANLLTYDRSDQGAMDVKNGRIDIMMSDYVVAQSLAQKLGGLKVAHQGVYSSGPMNIVVPLGDKDLGAAINVIIKQLKSEGFIDKLAVKYFAGTN